MIRWRAAGRNDRDLIGFGLEAGNIERLIDGQPIFIDGAELGLDCDVYIHYGPTKEAMLDEMQEHGFELPPEKDWKSDG